MTPKAKMIAALLIALGAAANVFIQLEEYEKEKKRLKK